MNASLVPTAATYALNQGVNTPVEFESVCNRIFTTRDSHDIPATTRPAASNTATYFIALGATTPYWLEQIGNIVLTYPWDRSTDINRPGQLRRSSIDS